MFTTTPLLLHSASIVYCTVCHLVIFISTFAPSTSLTYLFHKSFPHLHRTSFTDFSWLSFAQLFFCSTFLFVNFLSAGLLTDWLRSRFSTHVMSEREGLITLRLKHNVTSKTRVSLGNRLQW